MIEEWKTGFSSLKKLQPRICGSPKMYHVLFYGSECEVSQNMTCLIISYHQSYAPHTKYAKLELYLCLCMSIHNMVQGREKKSSVE